MPRGVRKTSQYSLPVWTPAGAKIHWYSTKDLTRAEYVAELRRRIADLTCMADRAEADGGRDAVRQRD